MKTLLSRIFLLSLVVLFNSCGALFNQPVDVQSARLGEQSTQTTTLKQLPVPNEPIVVGVYNFKDQTGQYKAVENGSTFSTAVTQGATTILIKALEDSKWFNPIERENLSNLLNERNIIRSTRDDYRKANPDANIPRLKPLLFAGILLEGGVISYDTNILTGGAGARYFGAGGSTRYRQDRITVYLRAVSTSNGAILKTVYVSKTILSQAVDVSLFRYVNFQRLLEVETGFTKNEPTQLAVSEAIEKAVEALIIEGIMDGLWQSQDGQDIDQALIDNYLLEKELEASTGLYERELAERSEKKHVLNVNLGGALINGDFSSSEVDANASLGYQYKLSDAFRVGVEGSIIRLNSSKAISNRYWWLTGDANLQFRLLPYDKFSPIFYGGGGYMSFVDSSKARFLQNWEGFFKVQGGAGFEYTLNPNFSIMARAGYHVTFTDKIDDVFFGSRNDHYLTFGIGLNYHFGGGKAPEPTN
ncbi:CsgG/HfaB family protein [Gilvibacter sediminis]|uniref:CsgG/HfaB family protein n=1 Tax=Gilvibacter sediminis TaxID=379071 RepID=UPI002350824E|nr:CsgG/HfaB family protein [Gilvibacter sediminis]MDC7999344.1 CsgG/HfaB family protein [Gilvibacter sediminis]